MKLRIKFVKEDCWIGVYWKTKWTPLAAARLPIKKIHKNGKWARHSLTVYVCIVPCFPIIMEFRP